MSWLAESGSAPRSGIDRPGRGNIRHRSPTRFALASHIPVKALIRRPSDRRLFAGRPGPRR